MPLDYSKWDKLELSDDEDFECHPNVDKASMVRWRQAEIHRKRRERKDKLAALADETDTNARAVAAFEQLALATDEDAMKASKLLAKLETLRHDSKNWEKTLREGYMAMLWKERDARWGPPEPDAFVEKRLALDSLAGDMIGRIAGLSDSAEADVVKKALDSSVKVAVETIWARQRAIDAEVKREEEEAKKKLTTDDIKEGFSKTLISKADDSSQSMTEGKAQKEKVIETIHTPKQTDPGTRGNVDSAESGPEDDEEAEYITYPPAQEFATKADMEASYRFLSKHPELVNQKYSDMILAEAFRKEMDRQPKAARQCVTQALLLQYCSLLGKDGVSLFFARLRSGNHNASQMFYKDITDTYNRIHERVKVLLSNRKEEEEAERRALEQRLEACTQPDGSLAIPITDDSTDEDKQRAVVFATLPQEFQRALLLQDVDGINAHLASLSKEAGEELVTVCSEVGLLNLEMEEDDETADAA